MRRVCWLALVASFAVAAIASWPGVAAAELRQTSGIVAELGIAANGLTDDDFAAGTHGIEIDPLIGLSLSVLARPITWVSAGVTVHYGFLYAQSDAFEEEGAGFLAALVGVRGHLPIGWFEPWLGLGLGYALTHFYATGDWPVVGEAKAHVSVHGVGIGLDGGLGFYVTEHLVIGPFFRLVFGIWPTACYDYDVENSLIPEDEDGCDTAEDRFGDRDMPHLWAVGLTIANTF